MQLPTKEEIEKLDRAGAVNTMNRAAVSGNNEIIGQILGLDFPEGKISPDDYPSVTLTPMTHAAAKNYSDTIRFLAAKGANVDLVGGPYAYNALRTATKNRSYAAIDALLDLGADPNIENADGLVALHFLCDECKEADIPSIERLLPVTHRRYYQRAHDWCRLDAAREKFAKLDCVNAAQPEGGFGGPSDKENDRMELPAEHPLVEQLRLAMLMCMNTNTDPNVVFGISLRYYDLPGSKWQPESAADINLDEDLLLNIVSLFCQVAKIDGDLPEVIPESLMTFDLLYPEIRRRYATLRFAARC